MNNLRGVLYAVVSSATFGLIPLFSIPLLQGGMSSPAILFYRFGLAAAMMGLIALATRRPLRITWPQTGTLLLLGAMYSVTALRLLRSYTYIPSSVATTINFLYPLGVAIVMTLFFREKIPSGCWLRSSSHWWVWRCFRGAISAVRRATVPSSASGSRERPC